MLKHSHQPNKGGSQLISVWRNLLCGFVKLKNDEKQLALFADQLRKILCVFCMKATHLDDDVCVRVRRQESSELQDRLRLQTRLDTRSHSEQEREREIGNTSRHGEVIQQEKRERAKARERT